MANAGLDYKEDQVPYIELLTSALALQGKQALWQDLLLVAVVV